MSTYLSLHHHVIFSTKHRVPYMHREALPEIHQYIGGIVKGLGYHPNIVGGVEDHIHILVSHDSSFMLANFMRELKKASSVWVKSYLGEPRFSWQDGYCGLTVSPPSRRDVYNYILRQEEHHKIKTSREELFRILHQAEIEYDKMYFE